MQQTIDINREIGRLETGVSELHRRLDNLRRELKWDISMTYRKQKNGNGLKLPIWVHMLAIAGLVGSSIAGFLKPEAAVAIIRALTAH